MQKTDIKIIEFNLHSKKENQQIAYIIFIIIIMKWDVYKKYSKHINPNIELQIQNTFVYFKNNTVTVLYNFRSNNKKTFFSF